MSHFGQEAYMEMMREMEEEREDEFLRIFANMKNLNRLVRASRDNLFDADKRNQMIRNHGYTDAERTKVEDVI